MFKVVDLFVKKGKYLKSVVPRKGQIPEKCSCQERVDP
jgi:hypothetical protein